MTMAGLLGLVTLQRLGELTLARRNTNRLRAQGGYEVSAGHYPLIVALHGAWLVGLWYLVVYAEFDRVDWAWHGIFVILQALRVWVIATLGARWTTRIIVLPGVPLIASGPYRFVSHPQLLRRCRRDAGAAACLWAGVVRPRVLGSQRRSATDSHSGGRGGARGTCNTISHYKSCLQVGLAALRNPLVRPGNVVA